MTGSSAGRGLGPLLSLQVRALLYGLGVRRGSGRLRALGAAAIAVTRPGAAPSIPTLAELRTHSA